MNGAAAVADTIVPKSNHKRSAEPNAMISPSLPELIARAWAHPFLGAHIVEGAGEHAQQAIARFGDCTIASAYEPIFDVGTHTHTHSFPQVLSASPESAERFGDELGVQAITLIEGDAPRDPFAQFADNRDLVTLDRLSRALHTFNFFGPQRHGLLFRACMSAC